MGRGYVCMCLGVRARSRAVLGVCVSRLGLHVCLWDGSSSGLGDQDAGLCGNYLPHPLPRHREKPLASVPPCTPQPNLTPTPGPLCLCKIPVPHRTPSPAPVGRWEEKKKNQSWGKGWERRGESVALTRDHVHQPSGRARTQTESSRQPCPSL